MNNNTDAKEHPYSKYQVDFRRFGQEFVSMNMDKGELVMKHPGANVRDFDLDKQPQIWVMMGWALQARQFARSQFIDSATKRRFQDYWELATDRLVFTRAAEFEFTKAMYDNSIDKRPLIMKVFGGHMGGTSWTTCVEARTSSGELLLTNTNLDTGVDVITRKAITLPDWYRNRNAPFFCGKPLRFDKYERPKHAECRKMRVHSTDLDANAHATWHTYVIMTINSANLLLKDGFLTHFRQNKSNGLQKLQLHFYGESLENDELEVYVWEDESQTNVMKSDVCKNGRSIFQALFKFFES